ncbi:MAG: hypothetical protein HOC64_08195 [Bacteroidetes bacterium]|nr:hypothetical protein [Bacteroidota bacterium]
MKDKIKYLISGIGPGSSGVGRLMRVLAPKYEQNGYKVVYKREPKSIRSFLTHRAYLLLTLEIFLRTRGKVLFLLKTYFIRNSEVVFLHPQTAGYQLLFRMIASNKVSLYVMDNSFFCIRSYNTNPVSNAECLNCVGTLKPNSLCNPFPIKMSLNDNSKYLNELKNVSDEINFLAQNDLQGELIKKHFGKQTSVSVIGMDTNEASSIEKHPPVHSQIKSYDVVYHGASIIAKGLLYVIELAEELPEFEFFVPDSKDNIEKVVDRALPSNVVCRVVTWETGLKGIVSAAKIVINPSMWSAPIEGALLKSAAFNPNVATVATEYGFERESALIKNHLRLNNKIEIGALQLKKFLQEYV